MMRFILWNVLFNDAFYFAMHFIWWNVLFNDAMMRFIFMMRFILIYLRL